MTSALPEHRAQGGEGSTPAHPPPAPWLVSILAIALRTVMAIAAERARGEARLRGWVVDGVNALVDAQVATLDARPSPSWRYPALSVIARPTPYFRAQSGFDSIFVFVAVRAALDVLRLARRRPRPRLRWEMYLANQLSLAILRRYDWRRATGSPMAADRCERHGPPARADYQR